MGPSTLTPFLLLLATLAMTTLASPADPYGDHPLRAKRKWNGARGSRQAGSGNDVDYVLLSLMQTTAYCSSKSLKGRCKPVPEGTPEWTIHGLWFNSLGPSDPAFCSAEKFDTNKLQPIIDRLNLVWPTLQSNNQNWQFWKHEWNKHGSCGGQKTPLKTQLQYFNASLALFDRFPIGSALLQAHITPKTNMGYSRDSISAAISTGLADGKKVKLSCTINKKSNERMLSEVRICFSRDLQLIDCPGRGDSCPAKNILYMPSGQTDSASTFFPSLLLAVAALIFHW